MKIRKRPKAEIKAEVGLQVVGLSEPLPNQLRWATTADGAGQGAGGRSGGACSTSCSWRTRCQGAQELRARLRAPHDEVHVTTVLVTHDQAEALDGPPARTHKGRIEQVGSPTDVYDAPRTPQDVLLGAVSTLNEAPCARTTSGSADFNMAVAAADGTAGSTGVLRVVVDRVVVLASRSAELTSAATGGAFTAQITRGDAARRWPYA